MNFFKNVFTVILAIVISVTALEATAGLANFISSDGISFAGGGTSLSQGIPDNTLAGVGYSINFGTSGLSLTDITVSFNISGGYNGDIYAYLSHGSQVAVLLNQISGAGAVNGSGFLVTLVEGTSTPIQTTTGTAGAVLSGTTFTANDNLSVFNNTDPHGDWTLFFADKGAGDTSTLNSFSLSIITAVPEPVNVALGIFGGTVGLLVIGRSVWRRKAPLA